MPTISGIEVRELTVDATGKDLIITVKYDPSLPTLIDITATSAKHGIIGTSFINDADPNNNIIVIKDLRKYLDDVIWLKIIIHHPTLLKYDFVIDVSQDEKILTTYVEKDDLSQVNLIYEGFILKDESQ